MAPQVLGATLLFVIVSGLLLRFFFWLGRRSRATARARAEAWIDQATKAAPAAVDLSSPSPVAPKAPAVSKPLIAQTLAISSPSIITVSKPSIAGTLAPGASATPAPVAAKPLQILEPLPAHIQPPKVTSTLQPTGATWTPPPITISRAEAASANPPPPAPLDAPKLGPLELHRPSIAGTLRKSTDILANMLEPEPQAIATPAEITLLPRAAPSIVATLAPGALLNTRPPVVTPPKALEPLPPHVKPGQVAATLQPAGAVWTPPPVTISSAEAATPNPQPTAPLVAPKVGPLELSPPSVGGTLANSSLEPLPASRAAEPVTISFSTPDNAAKSPLPAETQNFTASQDRPARSLSACASVAAPAYRANSRPAPVPRPATATWAVIALKTSLPFRVRRPETRLVGKSARDVVLISKARQATRVLGRGAKSRIAARGSRQLH